jgi:hypothetical protein
VHVRHGDFAEWCPRGLSADECFAPLSAYARAVDEVRASLAEQGLGADAAARAPVLVGSDEPRAEFWDEVAALGWRRIDHERERTVQRLGHW